MHDLTDRVILVTGAQGNLGSATAEAAARAGARTVLVDSEEQGLQRRFGDLDPERHLLVGGVDLTDGDAAAALVPPVVERFGAVDGLVNVVGTFRGGQSVAQEDLATWDFLLDLNLRTALNVCRAVVPSMLERGSGRIVNIAARQALRGEPGIAAYGASKGALLRFTESLAAEVKSDGLTVNAIMPGIIDTPMNREAMPDADTSTWVEPQALADVIVFLLSDAARAVTGAAIPVFGRG